MPEIRISKIIWSILVLIFVLFLNKPVKAQSFKADISEQPAVANQYTFLPEQSTLVQTGGIAGVHYSYAIEGQFQIAVDIDANTASFDWIDASAIDDSPYQRTLDPNEVFAMRELIGTIVDDTTLDFAGATSDGSTVQLTAVMQEDLLYITAATIPPPNSADFFVFDMNAVARRRYAGGTGEPNNPYKIAEPKNWVELMNTSADWDKCFILITNIDMNRVTLRPVGSFREPFEGIFDGNDCVIYNADINIPSNYVGLFGCVSNDGQITNLGLNNVQIVGDGAVGGLVGKSDGGFVNNCYSTGEVSGHNCVGGLVGENRTSTVANCYSTCIVSGKDHTVGGLVGHNWYGVVTNCSSTGTVSGNNDVGGLVGGNFQSTVADCYSTGIVSGLEGVGGLVGASNNGTVTDCYSTSSVNGGDVVGGLVGENWGEVTGCYSTGSVNGAMGVGGLVGSNDNGTVTNCNSSGTVSGVFDVGGLVGGGENGTVTNCYSTGSVNGEGGVGGLLGANDNGTVIDCYSTGSVNGLDIVGGLVGENWGGTVTNCYSTGTVGGNRYIGGFVGDNGSGHVNNCFWDIETSERRYSDGGIGKTTAEMQTLSTFIDAGWDFIGEAGNGPNDIWKMWDGYDYPRLAWEPGPNTPLVFVDINDPGFYGQMSKYEVTNVQYCDFLNAALASGDITVNGNIIEGAGGLNSGADYVGESYYNVDGSGYTGYGATNGGAARIHYDAGAFDVDDNFGNHPVTYVSWYGAMAFANYYGYYLPAEEQWQAVADYDGTYIYGCGETIEPDIANYRYSDHPDGTTVVGSFGIYGYGMSDLAGNVWEWTSSSLDGSRIFRGGSMGSLDSDCAVSIRGDGIPYANYWDIGFRVCR